MNYITNWLECQQHIIKNYPNEAGGIITQEGVFIPLENVSKEPNKYFEIDARDWIRNSSNIRAMLHSHVYDSNEVLEYDPRIPSVQDQISQLATAVEWAIVVSDGNHVSEPVWFGDKDHRPPLMDREFLHSIQDCTAFMKDWLYQEYGIELPSPPPRELGWYQQGYNFIEDLYEEWGFEDVTGQEYQRGDVVFLQIQSKVVNHVGVMADPYTMAHHLIGRRPVIERLDKWNKYTRRIVRHHSLRKVS